MAGKNMGSVKKNKVKSVCFISLKLTIFGRVVGLSMPNLLDTVMDYNYIRGSVFQNLKLGLSEV
jgi:hypothetical protein